MNSEALALKNGTLASPAVARASSVFPVPGGPESSTPLGARAPRRRYFSGSLRKSTTSLISASTSSMPATSSKVTRTVSGSTGFCLPPSSPPDSALCWRLNIQTQNATSRIIGRERDEQVGQEAALLDQRRGAHRRAVARQLAEQVVLGEGRPLGRELLVVAVGPAGNGRGALQLPFDGVAAGEHADDVLLGDLPLELRVGDGLRAREPVLDGEDAERDQVADQRDDDCRPLSLRLWRLAGRQPLRSPGLRRRRRGGRLPGAIPARGVGRRACVLNWHWQTQL